MDLLGCELELGGGIAEKFSGGSDPLVPLVGDLSCDVGGRSWDAGWLFVHDGFAERFFVLALPVLDGVDGN